MSYLGTDKIIVFPSARRVNKQASARLMSESSFVNIINKLIETDGFVITPEIDEAPGYLSEESFEFNIHGYYFKVEHAQDIINLFDSNTNVNSIYANIYLDKNGNFYELKGQDYDSNGSWVYQGVTFSDTNLSESSGQDKADYSLLLFNRESDTYGSLQWVVPIESRIKFMYSFALGVDGGEIK